MTASRGAVKRCQNICISIFFSFLTENPEENGVSGAFGEAKKEAKIGFAAAQMTRRKEDQRQTGVSGEGKKNPIGNLALQSNPSSETRRLKSPVCRGAAAAVQSASPSGASQARWSLGELRTALRSLANPLLCR